MNLLIKIKDILLKFYAWLIHFFKKKFFIKTKKKIKKRNLVSAKKTYKTSIRQDEDPANLILGAYPGVLPKELESINKKIDAIRKKVLNYNDENLHEELENINMINNIINKEQIFVNQVDNLNDLIDLTMEDQELHLDTNEKISILKDNISNLFDEELKSEEKNIIEKAYYEYEKVNYIIVTTMLIDEIEEELEMVYEKYSKNRYSKKEFYDKVREIEKKIERLRKINNKEEVEKEIQSLKSDLYTKRKDKYDLLYNEEIFVNIQKQCDELVIQVEKNEEQQKQVSIEKKIIEEKKREELKKEKIKKEVEKQQEETKEEKQFEENIMKRFMDLELARQILLKKELQNLKKGKNIDVIENTMLAYQEFIIGEQHEFNFLRNKLKLEVAKLYNDTLRNICILEDGPFIPVEHINLKFSDLVQETIENQQRLNNLLIEHKKVNLEETEISSKVNEKLNDVLEKEKKREQIKGKPKVLVRTYNPVQVTEENK